MLKTILLTLMTKLVGYLTSKEFMDTLSTKIKFYMDLDIPGETKKEQLLVDLKEIYGAAGDQIAGFAPHLVNLAIEVVVAKLKAEKNN